MKISKRAKRHPRVIGTLPALRRAIANFRRRGRTIALVPTMGALHEGHFSLVRRAQSRADCVVVSIFVNPTQFAPHEDLTTYPRTLAADVAALAERQVALIWAPSVRTMYPDGFATRVVPEGPARVGLEDASRPHFFAGVATVVAKLLIQCEPDIALFGEKDYQQLKVVTQLGRDLGLKSRIVGAPIAEALKQAREAISRAGLQLDYFEARNADTLEPLKASAGEPIRLLTAARIGTTRLIDNIAV